MCVWECVSDCAFQMGWHPIQGAPTSFHKSPGIEVPLDLMWVSSTENGWMVNSAATWTKRKRAAETGTHFNAGLDSSCQIICFKNWQHYQVILLQATWREAIEDLAPLLLHGTFMHYIENSSMCWLWRGVGGSECRISLLHRGSDRRLSLSDIYLQEKEGGQRVWTTNQPVSMPCAHHTSTSR